MNQNLTNVRIDLAAPYTEAFENHQKEYAGRYLPDEQNYRRSVEVYLLFRKLAWHDWGVIEAIDFETACSVTFTTKVYSIDLFEDSLKDFCRLLTLVDRFEADCPPQDEKLTVRVTVEGIRKKADRKIIELF